eukprot:TRINITY_DN7211_c0_g1_i1.p2 TRINITY_DN7211_c0_g1~~TRINITY_DN7211_c0_g1_i1.p2  ORF type:complete len:181 (+),score=72.11 TRINITY_DN7211_c0_g1_i1:96-638(+)
MARTTRSFGLLVLLAVVAALSTVTTFVGTPMRRPRQLNTARAGAKDGPFTPTVMGIKLLMGEKAFNDLRTEMIKLHGNAQKAAIDTHDTAVGEMLMDRLFKSADTDGNGSIDKEELQAALQKLGFHWMDEGRVDKIIEKADDNQNDVLEYDEFKKAAPKTLKRELLKLAKKNGSDLGFMS